MRYRIRHVTEYSYPETVSLCHNEARLNPRSTTRQRCVQASVSCEPGAAYRSEREDFFGNRVSFLTIEQPHILLRVVAESLVEVLPEIGQLDLGRDTPWDEARQRLDTELSEAMLEARPYRLESPRIPTLEDLADYARPSFGPGRPLGEAVADLMARIHGDFEYDPGFTTVSTPLETVLEHRKGVCQDFAHLAIGCLRAMGLAARYVSGYLETRPPPGQEKLQGADASHAWFSVFDPERGWLDFDPTNNLVPMDRHITLAWGRDYTDVAPLKGVLFGGGESHGLSVAVDVTAES
ncbi:transglutaminase family protein [Thioalkalivibrio sulfidiphilus]|uniref:Transglutaminase domain protein n=1 Tax=Thioalkalivibrio sulfidiphilus (strain HL-EbGR7) TaxID=396588 RepID=B8GP15_THISH|nr:transglutaminase family protein [Thioalkalivibrio sulfidiphilus]ACL72104.1 transglutaminase domain protein [Thioalkalivibrio sulfidiphilus HL-EbGr7]